MKKSKKVSENFRCEVCDVVTCRKGDFKKHLSTRKHKMATLGDTLATPNVSILYDCTICRKAYRDRRGLWSHNKRNHPEIENILLKDNVCGILHQTTAGTVSEELFMGVLKQNGELIAKHGELLSKQDELIAKHAVLEDKLIELTKERSVTVHNGNNNNNNSFNLNFYLNTTCKDAINYNDFIKSITIGQEEFQKVVENGYVDGHTMIIKNLLEKLEQHERPIQCSDLKRGTVHIKNGNEWFKDKDGNPHIEKITDVVTGKTMKEYGNWSVERPKPSLPEESADNYEEVVRARSKFVDDDLKVMGQVVGKGPVENKEINKNILKMVTIGREP
jgi:hypothetical protein